MKQVRQRTFLIALLVILLLTGTVVFCIQYAVEGRHWAEFSANDHAYTEGRLSSGQILDRSGVLLYDAASGQYAEDSELRMATLHAVGDPDDNISTAAKAALASHLIGYNFLTGTTTGGHRLYLTIDAELNRTAYEALDGRKGTVAVYNYETGDILCMVSSPTFDPADPPEILDSDSRYEGVYLNRFLSTAYPPGSVFKLVTAAPFPVQAAVRSRATPLPVPTPTVRWTFPALWPIPATGYLPSWRWSWAATRCYNTSGVPVCWQSRP